MARYIESDDFVTTFEISPITKQGETIHFQNKNSQRSGPQSPNISFSSC